MWLSNDLRPDSDIPPVEIPEALKRNVAGKSNSESKSDSNSEADTKSESESDSRFDSDSSNVDNQ